MTSITIVGGKLPNWVHNSVSFSGTQDNLNKLIKKLSFPNTFNESGSPFDFYNLIAPEDTVNYKENWYDWRCSHWGTKWNACDVTVYTNGIDQSVGEDEIVSISYDFDTAWSQPTGIIFAVAQFIKEKDMDIHMAWHYEEEQGWGGEWEYNHGYGIDLTSEYDIPNSHQEYTDRGGECACVDYEQKMFYDCPIETEGEE